MNEEIQDKVANYIDTYKKLEAENKLDEAIRVIDDASLYIRARIDAGMNFADSAILNSYFRDFSVVKRSIQTNKRISELELRTDNISFQVNKMSRTIRYTMIDDSANL